MNNIKLFEYQHKKVRSMAIDGQIWFVAKDVCEILEIVNVRDAVSRLSENQKRSVGIPDAINRERKSYAISESGVYRLTFRSNKPEASRFMDWLADEVIPQIRQTGKYVPKTQGILPLAEHIETDTQKEMSKSVNAHNYALGGVPLTVAYNAESCRRHTGKYPKQIMAEAKRKGVKSKNRRSAKAVLRIDTPEIASSMSLADNLVREGHDQEKVFDITVNAIQVFKGMLDLGATPAELKQLDKKKDDDENE